MILVSTLRNLYSKTIDRSKFREVASRYLVFVLPLFFWGRQPAWEGIFFVWLGLVVRAWGAGYLRKDKIMAIGGPYFFVRHPLYLGSCLLSLGLVITLHHWVVTLLLGGMTFLTYWHTIRHEELNLQKTFGQSYMDYMMSVGPLWPKSPLATWKMAQQKNMKFTFSWRQYMANKEYECALGVILVLLYVYLGSRLG